jgi:hypothetical protein
MDFLGTAMARKRKSKEDLRSICPDSREYWDEVLQREGLRMAAGRSDRLLYVGDSTQVELIHGMRETDTGRVVPKPRDE